VLSFLRRYPQGDPLASPHRYNGLFLTHNLVSAVMIRQDFNRPRRGLLVLGPTAGNRQYGHRCQQLQVQPSLSHPDTATGAAPPSEPRTSAVRLRPWPPLGAERLARPIPRLPDRSDRPYGVVQKQGRGIGLLLASLPDGSQQRFFSCSVQPPRCCSTGRSRQIFSLRATRSWLSFWKR